MAKKQHEDKNPPEFVKEAKKRLKKRRPEYKKKRVIVPSITATILIILGITAAIHATFYQSTDDAFVEGRLVSIAPRVSAPVIRLLVDDNQMVKKGDLLVELDPNDFQVALNQAEAKLAEAQANLHISHQKVNESIAEVNKTYEISEPEYSDRFKYAVEMFDDFTYITYLENQKNDKEDNWIVKEEMMIPTNYAKIIGKSIVELGKDYPDD